MRRPARAAADEEREEEKPVTEEYHSLASLTMDQMKGLEIVAVSYTHLTLPTKLEV